MGGYSHLQDNVLEVLHVADSLFPLPVPLQPPNLLFEQLCLLPQSNSRLLTLSQQLCDISDGLLGLCQFSSQLLGLFPSGGGLGTRNGNVRVCRAQQSFETQL